MPQSEFLSIIRRVEGATYTSMSGDLTAEPPGTEGYCLTIDNLLKIFSIQLRLKHDLPTVIMGETGCGKTALINYMCAV